DLVLAGQRQAATTAALRESEIRFRNMADHAPVMVWISEPDGACSYFSRSWYTFTGQMEGEALGFGWMDAVHPEERAQVRTSLEEAVKGTEGFQIDYRIRKADGTYRWAVDVAAPRFGEDGVFLGFVGSVLDI